MPVAVYVWLYATPLDPFAGAALVIVGATGPAEMLMLKFCVAAGAYPFDAVTVPVNVPTTLGVPVTAPAELKLSPVGSAPVVTAKVIDAVPVAVYVWL